LRKRFSPQKKERQAKSLFTSTTSPPSFFNFDKCPLPANLTTPRRLLPPLLNVAISSQTSCKFGSVHVTNPGQKAFFDSSFFDSSKRILTSCQTCLEQQQHHVASSSSFVSCLLTSSGNCTVFSLFLLHKSHPFFFTLFLCMHVASSQCEPACAYVIPSSWVFCAASPGNEPLESCQPTSTSSSIGALSSHPRLPAAQRSLFSRTGIHPPTHHFLFLGDCTLIFTHRPAMP